KRAHHRELLVDVARAIHHDVRGGLDDEIAGVFDRHHEETLSLSLLVAWCPRLEIPACGRAAHRDVGAYTHAEHDVEVAPLLRWLLLLGNHGAEMVAAVRVRGDLHRYVDHPHLLRVEGDL